MKSRHILTLVGIAVLAASGFRAALWAQGPPRTPPSVTFQTEVNYVDVDTIVTDAEGHFVPGLTRDDFEVFEDGKPQKVEMFSFVELPVEPADRFAFLDRPVSRDSRSNRRAFDGRIYVIALDDSNVSPLRSSLVRQGARDFVERHFGANDMAAVIYTSGRSDAGQDFTSDRALLLAAIDKFTGRRLQTAAAETLDRHLQRRIRGSITGEPQSNIADTNAPINLRDLDRENRALAVLDTLRNLGEFMSGVRGRRKAILLFSEGIEMPMSELYATGHTATDVLGAIKDAVTAAARSNVSFFALDPRGLIGMTTEYIELAGAPSPENTLGAFGSLNAQQGLLAEMRISQESLRTLAEETGGFAAFNTNTLDTAFDRIVDANSRYYVLGYYPPEHPRDGRFHRIEVRVKRPGLKVVARRGYAAPRGRSAADRRRDEEVKRLREAKRGGTDTTSAELREVLNSPMQQSGLSMSVQAAPFRNSSKEASVALAIEFDGDNLPFEPRDGLFANRLELTFFGIDERGKAQRTNRSELNLNFRPETHKRVEAGGLRANPRMALAPGRYQIRVGARESVATRVGTVFYDLDVPDFRKDPLMLSGLLITAASAQNAMTAMPDPQAPALLSGPATSRRTFPSSDALTVFAEIYDNMPARQARQIESAVTLIAESGKEVFGARDSVANPEGSAHWTAYGLKHEVPLKGLAPGRYLLRVAAQARDNSQAAVARETLITVQ